MAVAKFLTVPYLDRFRLRCLFEKIVLDPNSGCWLWTGATSGGYGCFRIGKTGFRAHRFLYAWLVEPVPIGTGPDIPVLDHICNNRRCCNPAHLRFLSHRDNILRGHGLSALRASRTRCHAGHVLPPAGRDGHRRCMICHRKWGRDDYAKRVGGITYPTKAGARIDAEFIVPPGHRGKFLDKPRKRKALPAPAIVEPEVL